MIQLVDDQHLGSILRGDPPPNLGTEFFTTGYWYVRLCRAVLTATAQPGRLSGPFLDLPEPARSRAWVDPTAAAFSENLVRCSAFFRRVRRSVDVATRVTRTLKQALTSG